MLAVTTSDGGGRFDGPTGPSGVAGRPREIEPFEAMRSDTEAARVWDASWGLVGLPQPA